MPFEDALVAFNPNEIVEQGVALLPVAEDAAVQLGVGALMNMAGMPAAANAFWTAFFGEFVRVGKALVKDAIRSAIKYTAEKHRELENDVKIFMERAEEEKDQFLMIAERTRPYETKGGVMLTMNDVHDIATRVSSNLKMTYFGGTVVPQKTEMAIIPRQQWMKCISKFHKHDIGNRDETTGADPYALLGCFNPLHVMNSEAKLNTGSAGSRTTHLDEASSSFICQLYGNNALLINRQWECPEVLMRHKAANLYEQVKVLGVKVAIKFTNRSLTHTIYIWWRLFQQGDRRVASPLVTDNETWPADANSLKGLQWDDDAHTGEVATKYNSLSRETLRILNSTPGMRLIELGPDSANGAPNEQMMYADIPCSEMLENLEPVMTYVAPATGPLKESDFPFPEKNYRLLDETILRNSFQHPMIYFWGGIMHDYNTATDDGQVNAIAGGNENSSTLFAEGTAEYSVHLFSAKNQVSATAADDLS